MKKKKQSKIFGKIRHGDFFISKPEEIENLLRFQGEGKSEVEWTVFRYEIQNTAVTINRRLSCDQKTRLNTNKIIYRLACIKYDLCERMRKREKKLYQIDRLIFDLVEADSLFATHFQAQ